LFLNNSDLEDTIAEVERLISRASEKKVELAHKIALESAASSIQNSAQNSRSVSSASENSLHKHSSFRFGKKH
jgi:hypothetical protein